MKYFERAEQWNDKLGFVQNIGSSFLGGISCGFTIGVGVALGCVVAASENNPLAKAFDIAAGTIAGTALGKNAMDTTVDLVEGWMEAFNEWNRKRLEEKAKKETKPFGDQLEGSVS